MDRRPFACSVGLAPQKLVDTAQHLYHAYAEDMPICDYHCHIPPREIYENRRFDNIAQVWLGGRNPDGSYFLHVPWA